MKAGDIIRGGRYFTNLRQLFQLDFKTERWINAMSCEPFALDNLFSVPRPPPNHCSYAILSHQL